MSQIVNVDNFVRAETTRMFDGTLLQTGRSTGGCTCALRCRSTGRPSSG